MNRYYLRRSGNFKGMDIPAVIDFNKLDLIEDLSERGKDYVIKGDILILNRVNRYHTREFVKKIIKIRTDHMDKILYLPGFGFPVDYPVLFYLGIDILDDSPLRVIGNDRCITEFGFIQGKDCIEKNLREKDRVMELIRLSVENNLFRELVESHLFSPFSKEVLRILDMDYYDMMLPFSDSRRKNVRALTIDSIYRPEVREFRSKVREMKQTAPNLLLIPCSAVKPYSRSKTHRILHSLIHPYLNYLQEVIVTTPLGLVPRELENFFPVSDYDVPVTGYWFNEEKIMLENIAKDFFSDKKYENVFFILSEEESGIIRLFDDPKGVTGVINFSTSEELLSILSSRKIRGDRQKKKRTEIINMVKYLYDVNLEIEGIEIKDEGNRSLILYKDEYLLKMTSSGLTMEMGLAKILCSKNKRIINVKGKFNGSNIFVPGIESIGRDIKPGMEVALMKDGEPIGRGIAEVASLDLAIDGKGIAVSDVKYFH
ncbi:MAG: DUF5591 domain-containing protein [Candidatus Thermoplasmatota archaeon]|jgi:archaeosine synthase|nr:DUF5591 domain-containing protein [Candidatus Thermoplasmatota archaeon]